MGKKRNNKPKQNGSHRRSFEDHLSEIAAQMEAADPSYKIEKEERQRQIDRNWAKLQKILPLLYQFLWGYKRNSGIFINNFLRRRTFQEYLMDKWEEFSENIWGKLDLITTFSFKKDNFSVNSSMKIGVYLEKLEEYGIAYHPINTRIVELVEIVANAFELHPPVEGVNNLLYRGCSTIERNGLNGIVSTTKDLKIALQFSRGTLLIIEVEEGTPQIDVARIRPQYKGVSSKDFEKEILLPPCYYEVLSRKTIRKGEWGDEPNNHNSTTEVIRVRVIGTQDLLEAFLEVMENPPEEYMEMVYPHTKTQFEEAKALLKEKVEHRRSNK